MEVRVSKSSDRLFLAELQFELATQLLQIFPHSFDFVTFSSFSVTILWLSLG